MDLVQNFSVAKENAREALSKDDFESAATILRQFRDQFGDTQDAKVLHLEVEAARSHSATAAMEKAIPDVRMLLMVRSFDSAESILESLSPCSAFAESPVREQYDSLRALVQRAKEQRTANELAEKQKQARISDQKTATDENVEIGATDAMSLSQLKIILGKVTQIGDNYQDNQKVQSAIEDLKQRLTLRIDALEGEAPAKTGIIGTPHDSMRNAAITEPDIVQEPACALPEAEVPSKPPTATAWVIPPPDLAEAVTCLPPAPSDPLSHLARTPEHSESASHGFGAERTAGDEAVQKLDESEKQNQRQRDAMEDSLRRAQIS